MVARLDELGWGSRHDACDVFPRDHSRVHEGLLDHRQCGLKSGHAHRGFVPSALLGFRCVWRVVGSDHVDRAVSNGLTQREGVFLGTQRRVNLEHWVVAAHHFFSQKQVVRGDLGGHVDALRLSPTDDLDATLGRYVAHVQTGVDVLSQQNIASDDRLLCDGRPTGQAELRRHDALVHLGALGQSRLLRVLRNHAVEGTNVFECPAHQNRVENAHAVVGEHTDVGAGVCHRTEFREALASKALSYCADRANFSPAGLLPQLTYRLDNASGVCDRHRVCHRVDRNEAAGRGGLGSGLDGFGVFTARFTQVSVRVNQARKGDQALGIDDLRVFRCSDASSVGDVLDDTFIQEDVCGVSAREGYRLNQRGRHDHAF